MLNLQPNQLMIEKVIKIRILNTTSNVVKKQIYMVKQALEEKDIKAQKSELIINLVKKKVWVQKQNGMLIMIIWQALITKIESMITQIWKLLQWSIHLEINALRQILIRKLMTKQTWMWMQFGTQKKIHRQIFVFNIELPKIQQSLLIQNGL